MHLPSTVRLLAFITIASVPLVVASTQALIHVQVDGVESMDYSSDYFTELAPVPMTKEQADQVCAKDPAYGPNYQACMDGPNGAPLGCVCKPSACLQPCFGVQYTSPKDGSRGCCPLGQTFSYDLKSLEGACCSNGTAFSYDPISRTGGCCTGAPDSKFTGTCSAAFTPCSKSFPGSVIVGGKNFIRYTNRGTWGTNLFGGSSAKTFEACEKLCAGNPKCVAIDFTKSPIGCYPKSDKNDKVPPREAENVDSAIIPPCLKKTDKCPAIDNTIRFYDGVAYTFKCKRVMGYGNVVPTYKTPDMLTCIQDCSKNPKCQGINYPVNADSDGGNCNLKSNYEENPKASDAYVAAVPLKKRG